MVLMIYMGLSVRRTLTTLRTLMVLWVHMVLECRQDLIYTQYLDGPERPYGTEAFRSEAFRAIKVLGIY
jgi:hypothetical protein